MTSRESTHARDAVSRCSRVTTGRLCHESALVDVSRDGRLESRAVDARADVARAERRARSDARARKRSRASSSRARVDRAVRRAWTRARRFAVGKSGPSRAVAMPPRANAGAEATEEGGLANFDDLARMESVREARDATLARVRGDVDGDSSDASGSERDGSEARVAEVEGGFRSVLTRKPSIAAIKAMVDLDALDGDVVSGESDYEGGGEDDEGVCSLSEFAMVLNAAAWDESASGQLSVDVIVKQLELLRGKVSSESSLSGVLGFDVHKDLSVRANTAGLVSVGAIAQVLYRGFTRARSMREMTMMGDLEKFEDLLNARAVKNISKVLASGVEDGIITFNDLKAKLEYFGVKSSMTDIISMMRQADIEGSGIVRVSDLSRLLAKELAQLRLLLRDKTEDDTGTKKVRISLDISRDPQSGQAKDFLLNGQAAFGILREFPTARVGREKPAQLEWASDEAICAVCLFDRSGTMMIEEEGQLVSLPTKLDYFTDVARGQETRTIVELPPPPTPEVEEKKPGFFSKFFCCFSG